MRKILLTATVAALFLIGLPPVPPAHAAGDDVVLADFEGSDSLAGATLAQPKLDTARRTRSLAAEGEASALLTAAATTDRDGRLDPQVFLTAGSTIPETDWTPHTYLHIGIANGTALPTRINLTVTDRAGHNAFFNNFHLAGAFDYSVLQIETARIAAAGVDLGQVARIGIGTKRTPNTQLLFADDIRLSGDPADPAPGRAHTATALIGMMDLRRTSTTVAAALERETHKIRAGSAAPEQALRSLAATLQQRLADYRQQIGSLDGDVAAARSVHSGLQDLSWQVRRLGTLTGIRKDRPAEDVGIAFADSMSRVYPRDLPCRCTGDPGEFGVVRGEHESVQLVAAPYAQGLTRARVTADVPDGSGLDVQAHPVVSLDMRPPVEQRPAAPTAFRPSVYTGWTPDPIQTATDGTDVAAGDLQAFWLSVRTTSDTRPGIHPVTLTLSAEGRKPQQVTLRVRVFDAVIDQQPHLRTAIGHDPKAYAEPYGVTDPGEIARLVGQEYAFLGSYKLQGDNIYRSVYESNPPSVESLRRIDNEYGGLRQFNVWYFDPRLFTLNKPDSWAAQADALFDRIQPYIDDYRAAGYADKAYLYCCDESGPTFNALITFVLTRFKERFPDIEVLSTAIDDAMGSTSGLDRLIDRWVRHVPWYEADIVDERHKAGKEAWWYLHQGNTNPTPNVFNGYDPGRLRVMLGPMINQADVDGFLYYRVDRWYGHGIVDDGPLSAWDPRTFGNWAGDGSLFYPGPKGPIPSIRLENMRDGLEDYNLIDALKAAVEHAPPGTSDKLIAKAKHLASGTDVVTDSFHYTDEPAAYRAWRADVAETIEDLG